MIYWNSKTWIFPGNAGPAPVFLMLALLRFKCFLSFGVGDGLVIHPGGIKDSTI